MSSLDSPNATFSPELASGLTHCAGLDGPTTDLCGLGAVRASHSARQVKAAGLLTSGTYGRHSSTSSSSAALQSSLESRLQAATQTLGSTLYKMTWKAWDTGSGRSRFRLRASVLRTSVTGSTGWPTPRAADGEKNVRTLEGALSEIARKGSPQDLAMGAAIAGWPTPLVGSTSPASHGQISGQWRKAMEPCKPHETQPARLTASGQLLTGSCAEMESGGQLNPAHSRWLQALPPEWDVFAPTAMPSTRKRRASS